MTADQMRVMAEIIAWGTYHASKATPWFRRVADSLVDSGHLALIDGAYRPHELCALHGIHCNSPYCDL